MDKSVTNATQPPSKKLKIDESSTSRAPREINIAEYAQSHAKEILALTDAVKRVGSSRNAAQALPIHMRRRAASHNIKRLPRRVREQAKKLFENQSGKPASKRPSRLYRRKPAELQTEYARRQRSNRWLETHVWHAKRFKMVTKWGHRLPLHPNDKSIRAAHRALTTGCLMRDCSYYNCIEVCGSECEIIVGLKEMFIEGEGDVPYAERFTSGREHGRAVLYGKCLVDATSCSSTALRHAIVDVCFLWRATGCPQDPLPAVDSSCGGSAGAARPSSRQLWLWCHPSASNEAFARLCEVYGCNPGSHSGDTSSGLPESEANGREGHVSVRSLGADVLLFKLDGPGSTSVLRRVLRAHDSNSGSHCTADSTLPVAKDGDETVPLLRTELLVAADAAANDGRVGCRLVLGLEVHDPRLLAPDQLRVAASSDASIREKRTKQQVARLERRSTDADNIEVDAANGRNQRFCSTVPPLAPFSAIWLESTRSAARVSKKPDQFVHRMRAEQHVLGLPADAGISVPLLLLYRPPTLKPHCSRADVRSGGWDVVLPGGWGMPFWVRLVYAGARTGGVREEGSICSERQQLLFPRGFPDAPAAGREFSEEASALVARHRSLPPDKRPNFDKLNVASPFTFAWHRLFGGLHSDETVAVLRDSAVLARLDELLQRQPPPAAASQEPLVGALTAARHRGAEPKNVRALVAVWLSMVGRGRPEQHAAVCLPLTSDFGLSEDRLCEPLPGRMGASSAASGDGSLVDGAIKTTCTSSCPRDGMLEAEPKERDALCSRDVIGYVIDGGFCLSAGCGLALAFCSADGLRLLAERAQEWTGCSSSGSRGACVLVRNVRSMQYRFAEVRVHY